MPTTPPLDNAIIEHNRYSLNLAYPTYTSLNTFLNLPTSITLL